jgi:hypothetical protein
MQSAGDFFSHYRIIQLIQFTVNPDGLHTCYLDRDQIEIKVGCQKIIPTKPATRLVSAPVPLWLMKALR